MQAVLAIYTVYAVSTRASLPHRTRRTAAKPATPPASILLTLAPAAAPPLVMLVLDVASAACALATSDADAELAGPAVLVINTPEEAVSTCVTVPPLPPAAADGDAMVKRPVETIFEPVSTV